MPRSAAAAARSRTPQHRSRSRRLETGLASGSRQSSPPKCQNKQTCITMAEYLVRNCAVPSRSLDGKTHIIIRRGEKNLVYPLSHPLLPIEATDDLEVAWGPLPPEAEAEIADLVAKLVPPLPAVTSKARPPAPQTEPTEKPTEPGRSRGRDAVRLPLPVPPPVPPLAPPAPPAVPPRALPPAPPAVPRRTRGGSGGSSRGGSPLPLQAAHTEFARRRTPSSCSSSPGRQLTRTRGGTSRGGSPLPLPAESSHWWDLAFWLQLQSRPSPILCIAHAETPEYGESRQQVNLGSYDPSYQHGLVIDDDMGDRDVEQALAPLNTEKDGCFWAIGKLGPLEIVGIGSNKHKRVNAIKFGINIMQCLPDVQNHAVGNTGAIVELLRHVRLTRSTAKPSVPDRFIQWHKGL